MRKQLCIFLLLCLCCAHMFGQAKGTGAYQFATFDSLGFDSINVGNLNVRFTIPIVSRTGRGLPFNYALQYEGLIWSNTGGTWTHDPAWGFTGTLNGAAFAGYMTYTAQSYTCPNSTPQMFAQYIESSNYTYHDPFGGVHVFNYDSKTPCPGTGGQFTIVGTGSAYDDSGYYIDKTSGNPSQVFTRSGSVITPARSATGQDPANVTDSNGNQLRSSGSGTFTDTLGKTALTISGSSPLVFAYPVALQQNNAATASANLSYRTYTVRTNFHCPNIVDPGSQTVSLPYQLTLADNSSYTFAYEATPGASDGAVTGRLGSITLPTGGTISYSYTSGCGGGINADGTVGILTRTTTDGTRKYNRAPINGNSTSTTVVDEKSNSTYYAFSIDATMGEFFETHRQAYQGNTSGTLLMNQSTCYNGASGNCDGSTLTLPISEQDVTVSYNGGSQVLTKNSYDPNGALLTGSAVYSGSTKLKNIANSYNSLGELTDVSSTDGNGNAYAYLAYRYDEGSVTATSGIPQHVAASGPRGNLTSTHLSAGSTFLVTSTSYYDTGVPVNTTGADGGVTSYTYDSTQGFVTATALPTPSSGVSLGTTAQYDVTSTALTSATGMNSDTTTVNAYDGLMRPIDVSLPRGSRVTAVIDNPAHSTVYQTLDANRGSRKETQLDSYGRVSRVNVYNGQQTNAWYQVDYCYDATGLLQFQSSPYQGTGLANASGPTAKHCSGSGTAYTYDTLGRTTGVTTDDGTSTTKYSSRAVQTTDVNNVSKITQYDLLGRIAGVCEISSTSYAQVGPSACGMDLAGTGFLTTYAYDLVNHQTTVTQGGESRTFATDPAGRPTSTTEPERGTTTYKYAYNSVGLQVMRGRPRANQTSTTATNTTTQYDLLGRLVSISYDDSLTPAKYFYYDTDDPNGGWSSAASNPRGRLVAMRTTSNTRAQFMYDIAGNVVSMQQCTAGTCGTGSQQSRLLSFDYDLANTLKYENDATTGAISYGLSPAEEIVSVTNQTYSGTANPSNMVSNVVNGPTGPVSYTLGNGLSVYASHDSSGRLNARWLCSGTAQVNCPTQLYGTDVFLKGSRVTGSDDTALGGYAAYGYDDLNRLASVNRTLNNQTIFAYNYSYDRYGNRGAQTQTGGNSRPTSTLNFAFSNHITSPGYSYDSAGNLLSDGVNNYTYDAEGNVLSVNSGNTAQYTYDAFNRRVSVQNSSGSTDYTYDAFGQRIASRIMPQNFGNEGRIYMNGALLAYRSIDGSTVYSTQDVLGTERMRTNYAGQILDTFKSLPFGDGYTAGNGNSGSATYQDNLHFSELEHDAETSTEHATFRQYSSFDGRWMSPDPYDGSYNFLYPQSFNRYAYALNNPIAYKDPSGLSTCDTTSDGGNSQDDPNWWETCTGGNGTGTGGGNDTGTGGGYDPNDCNDPHVTCASTPPTGDCLSCLATSPVTTPVTTPISIGTGTTGVPSVGSTPVPIKIHGYWCGPDWTGGTAGPYNPATDASGGYKKPIDADDTACMQHDKCYAMCRQNNACNASDRGDCFAGCDRRLAGATNSDYSLTGALMNIVMTFRGSGIFPHGTETNSPGCKVR